MQGTTINLNFYSLNNRMLSRKLGAILHTSYSEQLASMQELDDPVIFVQIAERFIPFNVEFCDLVPEGHIYLNKINRESVGITVDDAETPVLQVYIPSVVVSHYVPKVVFKLSTISGRLHKNFDEYELLSLVRTKFQEVPMIQNQNLLLLSINNSLLSKKITLRATVNIVDRAAAAHARSESSANEEPYFYLIESNTKIHLEVHENCQNLSISRSLTAMTHEVIDREPTLDIRVGEEESDNEEDLEIINANWANQFGVGGLQQNIRQIMEAIFIPLDLIRKIKKQSILAMKACSSEVFSCMALQELEKL